MRDYDRDIREYQREEYRVREFMCVEPDERLEFYGLFLEEGDFERYQPFCYGNRDHPEFHAEKLLVDKIPIEGTNHQKMRAAWIKGRFEVYGGKPWHDYNLLIGNLYESK